MHTAVSLALAVLAGAAAYVIWAAHEIALGADILWFIAGAPFAALAIPAFLTLLWLTISWLYRARRPAAARIAFIGLLRLYRGELLAIAGSVPRMILYRWLVPDPVPAPAVAPVLLLHGILCNAGVWLPMKKYFAARGIGPIYALSYGPPLASINTFADQAADRIDAITRATGAKQVIIVGHSMGGLVARAYVRRHGGAKVRRLVTIGTPHHGSVLAHMVFGVAPSQLRPGSAWLSELAGAESDARPPIVSLWSWHDTMVAPQTSSLLEGAENVALTGIGHNELLSHPQVHERVAAEIVRASGVSLSGGFAA